MKRLIIMMMCAGMPFLYAQEAGGRVAQTDMPEAAIKELHQKTITVSGRLRIVGNMPFTQTVLTDDGEADWFIPNAERVKVEGLRTSRVTLTGTARIVDLILADGKRVGIRRYLENISVSQAPESTGQGGE